MNRACRRCRKDLVAYYDSELTADRMRAVADHLEGCPDCSSEFSSLQEAMAEITEPQTITPSPDYDLLFWNKIRALRSEKEARQWKLLEPLRILFARRSALVASACIALCLCMATIITLRHNRTPSAEELALARHMELFANYDVIEKSDALEHFELITVLDTLAEDAGR